MMIQGGKNAGKKLFVILILGMTLLQSGCNNKATKETQQKAEKTDGAEKQKKLSPGTGKKPGQLLMANILKL